jgi:hypothetical protein
MSKTVFSSALFEQMGGVNWSTRPGSLEFYPQSRDGVESKREQAVDGLAIELSLNPGSFGAEISDDVIPLEESPEPHADNSESLLATPQPSPLQAVAQAAPKAVIEKATTETPSLPLDNRSNVVVVGAGLDAVWQNDETQAWQLWQNIMLAFDWDESRMTFFDTSHLVSEEMIFTTMEEIIGLGVDWVLTMDDEHPISEQLVEGVHVVAVPDLESMLSDPYAKQNFYHAVVELSNQL